MAKQAVQVKPWQGGVFQIGIVGAQRVGRWKQTLDGVVQFPFQPRNGADVCGDAPQGTGLRQVTGGGANSASGKHRYQSRGVGRLQEIDCALQGGRTDRADAAGCGHLCESCVFCG